MVFYIYIYIKDADEVYLVSMVMYCPADCIYKGKNASSVHFGSSSHDYTSEVIINQNDSGRLTKTLMMHICYRRGESPFASSISTQFTCEPQTFQSQRLECLGVSFKIPLLFFITSTIYLCLIKQWSAAVHNVDYSAAGAVGG